MSDWIEEAEMNGGAGEVSHRKGMNLDQRKQLVDRNYQLFAQKYDGFITELSKLVARVNNLPPHVREPFGKLEARPKKSKLDNHLFILSSSYRFRKRKAKGLFGWFSYRSYKHIRVIYFSVSKIEGKVDVEVKDYVLEKHRLGAKGEDKSTLHDHLLGETPMVELNREIARVVIDWLAFKSETQALPFSLNLK